ncbi:MAG: hypothetical protein HC900_05870 [Methylacidiphilales bacterium]|nr:hypothetical protein [Candidatus Methylacidiphilales bacterium]
MRRAKQLAIEAHRVGAAADLPNRAELLASLAADLDDVHQAMAEELDAIKQQLDAAVRQKAAVTAYGRIAQTLTTNRTRT